MLKDSRYRSIELDARDALTEISSMNFDGLTIPTYWFRKLKRKVNSSNKYAPDVLAICMLAEIVRWYVLEEDCSNERSVVRPLVPKFHGKVLIRDIQYFVDFFEVTPFLVEEKLRFLERKRVIRIEEISDGFKITPLMKRLKKITYPTKIELFECSQS